MGEIQDPLTPEEIEAVARGFREPGPAHEAFKAWAKQQKWEGGHWGYGPTPWGCFSAGWEMALALRAEGVIHAAEIAHDELLSMAMSHGDKGPIQERALEVASALRQALEGIDRDGD